MITRFAPSPTGPLHLGHAYSAWVAQDLARAQAGTFLLRIDDLDETRSRLSWETQLKDDLAWLGLGWPEPCRRQSDHLADYQSALDALWAKGVLYPCTCTRRDIRAAASAPNEGEPRAGPDGIIYPGTCRPSPDAQCALRGTRRPLDITLRLNVAAALAYLGPDARNLRFRETGQAPDLRQGEIFFEGAELVEHVGDVALARHDGGAAYHLAVVIDDSAQGITHVVRGADLFEATKIHVLLQRLLDLPSPVYHHHRLIRDGTGKRLAKRDDARAIATYRQDGVSPQDVRALVG